MLLPSVQTNHFLIVPGEIIVSVQFLLKSAVVASVMAIASVAAPVHAASITSSGSVSTGGAFTPLSPGNATLTTGVTSTDALNNTLQNFVGVGSGDLDVDPLTGQAFRGSALKFMFSTPGTLAFNFSSLLDEDDYVFAVLNNVVTNLGATGAFSQAFTSGDLFSIGIVDISDNEGDSSLLLSNATFTTAATAVPTPALLPGLIGLGLSAMRKRKQQQA
jgi:hypothetical protein